MYVSILFKLGLCIVTVQSILTTIYVLSLVGIDCLRETPLLIGFIKLPFQPNCQKLSLTNIEIFLSEACDVIKVMIVLDTSATLSPDMSFGRYSCSHRPPASPKSDGKIKL